MSSDTYKVDVHPDAERAFQRLSDDARAFVHANVIEWAERDARLVNAGIRSDRMPHKTEVITYSIRERDAYGLYGVAVSFDHQNARATITALVIEQP